MVEEERTIKNIDDFEFFISICKEISFDELTNIFREEFPVYGNFLKYFTIRLGEMPYEYSTPLLEIGEFYRDIKNLARSLLSAYIDFSLLESGYIDTYLIETYIEVFGDSIEKIKYEDIKDFITVHINNILKGEIEADINMKSYINLKDNKSCLKVFILTEFPRRFSCEKFEKFFSVTSMYSKNTIDKWIEGLNEYPTIFGKKIKCKISKFIVVDPILYRLSKEAIDGLRKRVKDKIGQDIVYHIEKFSSTFLQDKQIFNKEWKQKRENVIKNLKRRYPFLSLYEEIGKIRDAEEEFRAAIASFLVYGSELPKQCSLGIIWKICRVVEAILNVMYHYYKKESSANKTFGSILNNLREEIIEEYGKDVYDDLEFIRQWRNAVAHPRPVEISREDVIKIIKKAELFIELFNNKTRLFRNTKKYL